MRKVTCRITGESGYSHEFYKAPNGKYYKNKELYDNMMAQKETKGKIFYLINSDILNKHPSNCGSLIGKLINETGLEPDVIYDSILQKMDYIKKVINESDESDSTKIHLIFSIATKRLNRTTYAGCYEIRNNKTNTVYIGESINLFGRFTEHISELYANKHHCKALQEAFNECHDISHFKFTPLCLYEIKGKDRETEKHNTLYLECAYFLKYKKEKKTLYNTVNPYVVLKENSVSLENYTVDCKKVLELLLEDKQNILPEKVKEKIEKDLK